MTMEVDSKAEKKIFQKKKTSNEKIFKVTVNRFGNITGGTCYTKLYMFQIKTYFQDKYNRTGKC